jgi:hypothetical protein
MKRLTTQTLAVLLSLAFALPALAVDYYIHGQTGSDANSGLSAALAKKTFNSLVGTYTIASGDRIYVAEQVRDNTSITGGATGGAALLGLSGVLDLTRQTAPIAFTTSAFYGPCLVKLPKNGPEPSWGTKTWLVDPEIVKV